MDTCYRCGSPGLINYGGGVVACNVCSACNCKGCKKDNDRTLGQYEDDTDDPEELL